MVFTSAFVMGVYVYVEGCVCSYNNDNSNNNNNKIIIINIINIINNNSSNSSSALKSFLVH